MLERFCMTDDSRPKVSPLQVLIVGGLALSSGLGLTVVSSYNRNKKLLVREGIDPHFQAKFIPYAATALFVSTLCVGGVGFAGFHLMRSQGFFRTDRADLPTLDELYKLLTPVRWSDANRTQPEIKKQ
jgi:hypothetical protein